MDLETMKTIAILLFIGAFIASGVHMYLRGSK